MSLDARPPAAVFSPPRPDRIAPNRRTLPRVAAGCAAAAGLLGLLGLAGWIFHVEALQRIAPGLATMKANTAIALVLLAASLLLRRTPAVAGVAVAAAVLPGAQLVEYATRRNLGVDQLLFTDPGGGPHPGRTSVAAAACLLLLVVARLLLVRGLLGWSQLAAAPVAAACGLAVVGYLYDVHSLYALRPFSSIALHTTLGLALLLVAVLSSVPGGVLPWSVLAGDAGAALVRQLAPLALVGMPFIGYLCVEAEHVGWVDGDATVALLVVLAALAVTAVCFLAARRLSASDARRARALADLTELKSNLERQVQERAALVQARRDEIMLLEDRQRIAADLHDVVIQRLFAAGMFLQGAAATDAPAEVHRRIDTAVEAMDGAIKDLRASIFELGGWVATVDLASAFDDVCAESARVLGFTPSLTVDDPGFEAETMREDLLAVLREALANVARHADATRVVVVLRTGDGSILLTITDDGRGISAMPHSSGTRNMADRARQRGGDCSWTSVRPHGTRVQWQVPGVPTTAGAETESLAAAVDEAMPRTMVADAPITGDLAGSQPAPS